MKRTARWTLASCLILASAHAQQPDSAAQMRFADAMLKKLGASR